MNVYSLSFKCPDIMTQADAEIVRATVLDSPGVGDVDVDFINKIVLVSTANVDEGLDVRTRLFQAGYPPEEE